MVDPAALSVTMLAGDASCQLPRRGSQEPETPQFPGLTRARSHDTMTAVKGYDGERRRERCTERAGHRLQAAPWIAAKDRSRAGRRKCRPGVTHVSGIDE